jgi:transposase
MMIGVDYHPSFQTTAFLIEETGECGEQDLNQSDGEAERFYRDLKQRGIRMRVGMEATGYSRWFERLLTEFGFELWIGEPAETKAKRVKKLKNDREDARLLRRLMLEKNFPRIWVPDPVNRDLRQTIQRWLELHDRKPLCKFFDANNGLDTSLIVPPLWRSLGVTLWQF